MKFMSAKIHLVEGLPAAGKSTFSYILQAKLRQEGRTTVYYKEETSQPVDLFRQSVLPQEEYAALADRYPSLREELEQNSFASGPYHVVAYTKLRYDAQLRCTALEELRSYDIGDGRVPLSEYQRLHLYFLRQFVTRAQKTSQDYIVEGAFLHNQLLDIIGFYDLPEAALVAYYRELLEVLAPLRPHIYYIYPSNIEALIDSALTERGESEGTWGWGFASWIECAPYGQRKSLHGRSGMAAVYRQMHRASRFLIEGIGADAEWIERQV